MSNFHTTHWVEFYPKSHFSAPVFVAVNCITFDAISRLSGSDADLLFATNHCFICYQAIHRSESCPLRSLGMLFCKRLDDPHSELVLYWWLRWFDSGWDVEWDAHCPGLTATIRREKHWENESGWWEWAHQDGVNGWGEPIEYLTWTASPEKLFLTFYVMSRGWPNRVWPRVDNEENVAVEVRSHVKSLIEAHPACRCCSIRTDPSYQPDQPFMKQLCRCFL
jgi:hypothetical protein